MKTNTACLNLIDADLDNAGGNTTLHVLACAPTLGWRDVSLSSMVYALPPVDGIQVSVMPPVDGIQDFILHGQAPSPSCSVATAIETFQLSAPVPQAEWLQGIRISTRCGESLQSLLTIRTPTLKQKPIGDDFITIESAGLKGDKLIIDVRYGGGCAPHTFQLDWDGMFLKSKPMQVVLRLSHNANDDPCKAILSERLQFDLSAIIKNPSQYVLRVTSGLTEVVAHRP
ncbi:hypothetical protein [Candidatus Electronema sp. JC]|uniref:hypothetical protein n=1 Tax=Candidatus Electronema sp. JC TaxID=3401570 RepID=UPI003AA7E381